MQGMMRRAGALVVDGDVTQDGAALGVRAEVCPLGAVVGRYHRRAEYRLLIVARQRQHLRGERLLPLAEALALLQRLDQALLDLFDLLNVADFGERPRLLPQMLQTRIKVCRWLHATSAQIVGSRGIVRHQ